VTILPKSGESESENDLISMLTLLLPAVSPVFPIELTGFLGAMRVADD
jgi:hypothetical protein